MIHCVRRITVKSTIKIHARIHHFWTRRYLTQLWRLYVDRVYRLGFYFEARYPEKERAKERGITCKDVTTLSQKARRARLENYPQTLTDDLCGYLRDPRRDYAIAASSLPCAA
jgi:hypothetical protein